MTSVEELEPKVAVKEQAEVEAPNKQRKRKTLLEEDVKQAAAILPASIDDSMDELSVPLLVETPKVKSKTVEDAVLEVHTEVVKEAAKEEKQAVQKIDLATAEEKVVKKELVDAKTRKADLQEKKKDIESNILKAKTPKEQVQKQIEVSKVDKELAIAEATIQAVEQTASEVKAKKKEAEREKEAAVSKKKESKEAVQKAIQDVQTKQANVKLLEGISTTTVSEYPNLCIGKFLDASNGGHVMAICSAGPENTCPSVFSEASCIRLESIKSDLSHITLKKGW